MTETTSNRFTIVLRDSTTFAAGATPCGVYPADAFEPLTDEYDPPLYA